MLQLLWNRFAYGGVAFMPDESEHKNIVLVNSLAIAIAFFSSATVAFWVLVLQVPLLSAEMYIPLAFSVLVLFTLRLNRLGKLTAARLYFSLLSLASLVLLSLRLGVPSNFHFYMLTGLMLQFFIFPAREKAWMYCMAIGSFLIFLYLQIFRAETPGMVALNVQELRTLRIMNGVGVGLLSLGFAAYISAIFRTAERHIRAERAKSERLLLNILPESIAVKLRENPDTIAERFENCTVLFSDIVGFSELSRRLPAVEIVRVLNDIFSQFDDLAEKHNLEKIKTIGDAYMVVGGLPEPHHEHAERVARFALEMLEVVRRYREDKEYPLELRVGISSGAAVAGVIGKKKFVYDLWGDSVNTASRMESHGLPGRVQVTESTYDLLKDKFELEERGTIEVKGLGNVRSFLLQNVS